ncbi:MAG: GatB/YqeY domain-containing protein [Dehalococcoidales bacterium]|nr:GatB/YqeY domain-containing protein [Dehalococcoidales bacterium]
MDAPLKEKLNSDLKEALRGGDKVKLGTVRLVLASVSNAEIAKRAKLTDADKALASASEAEIAKKSQLEDGDILSVIAREIKQRNESIDAYKKGNRPDLVAQEEAELAVLQSYMPKQVSREEIVVAAKRIIAEVGAKGPNDKGRVMPKIIGELKGKADGKEINAVVTELLNNPG